MLPVCLIVVYMTRACATYVPHNKSPGSLGDTCSIPPWGCLRCDRICCTPVSSSGRQCTPLHRRTRPVARSDSCSVCQRCRTGGRSHPTLTSCSTRSSPVNTRAFYVCASNVQTPITEQGVDSLLATAIVGTTTWLCCHGFAVFNTTNVN